MHNFYKTIIKTADVQDIPADLLPHVQRYLQLKAQIKERKDAMKPLEKELEELMYGLKTKKKVVIKSGLGSKLEAIAATLIRVDQAIVEFSAVHRKAPKYGEAFKKALTKVNEATKKILEEMLEQESTPVDQYALEVVEAPAAAQSAEEAPAEEQKAAAKTAGLGEFIQSVWGTILGLWDQLISTLSSGADELEAITDAAAGEIVANTILVAGLQHQFKATAKNAKQLLATYRKAQELGVEPGILVTTIKNSMAIQEGVCKAVVAYLVVNDQVIREHKVTDKAAEYYATVLKAAYTPSDVARWPINAQLSAYIGRDEGRYEIRVALFDEVATVYRDIVDDEADAKQKLADYLGFLASSALEARENILQWSEFK